MSGVRKPFDKKLFDESDPPARQQVMQFLTKCGFNAWENRHQFGVDLVASKNGKTVHVEVERRGSKHTPGKYSTINVPSRKDKFLGVEFAYASLSQDMDTIAWLPADKVKVYFTDKYRIENPNCYVREGELFFSVPTSEWTIIKGLNQQLGENGNVRNST